VFDISASAIEDPFETTRAITNILLKKARAKFPDVKVIFPHGGGTVPFLAERIISHGVTPDHLHAAPHSHNTYLRNCGLTVV
jgi:predicted TIM-barrel fold metal-dependent hydrolase